MKLLAAPLLLLPSSTSIAFGSKVHKSGSEEVRGEKQLHYRKLRKEGPTDKDRSYDCDGGCETRGGSPVCGADGNTYFNECIAVCQDVRVGRNGACPSDPPMKMNSYVKKGRVTKEEMDKLKTKGFKLVAKRNPYFGKVPRGERRGKGRGRGSGSSGAQRSVKVTQVMSTGLEYVAKYEIDKIPEGTPYNASEEGMPSMPNPPDDGGSRLLTVIGRDTRVEEAGTDWPNWRLVQLDWWLPHRKNFHGGCSGAIVGVNKVLTSAHCVWDDATLAWRLPTRVAPGRTDTWDPWGTWSVDSATIYDEYIAGNWGYDIAILTISGTGSLLPGRDIGSYMGYLGMTVHPCSPFPEEEWRITGYPGDKPSGTIWNAGECDDWFYVCGSMKIYHQCDTAGGMSGSAIRAGNNGVIVGVHAYGLGGGFNSGTAMTIEHLANVQHW